MVGSLRAAVEQARRDRSLFFAALLPEKSITTAFAAARASWSGYVYSPAVTVWVFLSQCLSADHSCRDAVGRLIGWLMACGRTACSPKTGAYCLARNKMPEAVGRQLLRATGRAPEEQAPAEWLWHGRRVRVADGSMVTMPDTPENQLAYPQHGKQGTGCGFPIVRIVVLFSLATGTVIDMALGKLRGKHTGENSLLRTLRAALDPGDVLVLDRYFCGWFDFAAWQQRGVDFVVRRRDRNRRTDPRVDRRLGPNDHGVGWCKPPRPAGMSAEEYAAWPAVLTLREVRVTVTQPGFRTRVLTVVTSLLDPTEFPAAEIAHLYRRRWEAEINLRSVKIVLQMDHLRCLTPHRVRNEICFHLIGYNLIRGVMAAAARAAGRPPWTVSFKGALQAVNNLLPAVLTSDAATWCAQVLRMAAAFRVADRPDRYEPRVIKRSPKHYPKMRQPRANYRRQITQNT